MNAKYELVYIVWGDRVGDTEHGWKDEGCSLSSLKEKII